MDFERFEPESFGVADINLDRIVYYVLPSREPFFLFLTPPSVGSKVPWEVVFKAVHLEPMTYQLHFEFTNDIILPNWYNQKRVSKVERVHVLPLQGNFIFSVVIRHFK